MPFRSPVRDVVLAYLLRRKTPASGAAISKVTGLMPRQVSNALDGAMRRGLVRRHGPGRRNLALWVATRKKATPVASKSPWATLTNALKRTA